MRTSFPLAWLRRLGMSLWALGLLVACSGPLIADQPSIHLQTQPLTLASYHLFDLGVADMNQDGTLDIFTANHSARQSFLLGDGHGAFGENRLDAWGLSQVADYPGWEDSTDTPEMARPGLYIFWREARLILHFHQAPHPISGQVAFLTPIDLAHDPTIQTQTITDTLTSQIERHTVSFVGQDGELIITPQPMPRVGTPLDLSMDERVPLNQVYLGAQAVPLKHRQETLLLMDRHGIAWHVNTRLDVLMAGGASRGLTAITPTAYRPYEPFTRATQPPFQRLDAETLGLHKGACPARQVGLVDVNRDNRADIYVVCARDEANQLFIQQPDGRFQEAAADWGLAIPGEGTFAWMDVEQDGYPDLIWASLDGVWLYRSQGKAYAREALDGPKGWVRHIALGDADGDGDGDVFLASMDGNALYENRQGRLMYHDPRDWGLPVRSLTANWVDVDNDGLLDLHALPSGLYRQTDTHHFQPLNLLQAPNIDPPWQEARATWFDADNDGYRDLLMALRPAASHQWRTQYLRNIDGAHHWLTLDLIGPPGNPAGVGARLNAQIRDRHAIMEVGWAEGSHDGFGHTRLYLGLGDARQVQTLTITWSDGTQQVLTQVSADQHLIIPYETP